MSSPSELHASVSSQARHTRAAAWLAVTAVFVTMVFAAFGPAGTAKAQTVGSGFTVSTADLAYILKQIKIAEAHVANTTSETGPCGALIGTGVNKVPDAMTSYGLRTVDGSCNNLVRDREGYGAADRLFPRLTSPTFADADERSPFGPPGRSSYAQKSGSVVDNAPRLISNLIVDQTSTNPAAVAAAGYPIRSQNAPGKFPCTTDPDPLADPPVEGSPAGCVPTGETLFIPNVTTDVGLSPPYNSLFTLFGQFFDHGIDQTVKGGGTVFMPLKSDDPLRTKGPDGKAGTGDEVPAHSAFMVLTRALNQPGADGVLGTADDVQNALNTDSPYVDQSQTYASHASHQVFLREYVLNPAGRPVSSGKLLGGPAGPAAGGMATWAGVKKQSAELLGLKLADRDVLNVPQLAVDPYGKFLPGPERGLPMYVTPTGMVEGDTANPVPVPSNAIYFHTPFLTDIAHHADPSLQDHDHNPSTAKVAPTPDADTSASADFSKQAPGTYDDEMLDAHFIAGDGRVNENIGLTAIHQVFHSEHDRLVSQFKTTLTNDTTAKGVAALAEWKLAAGAAGWNGERLFQAARYVAEMEYQHLVFEEFARKVQPDLDPFRVYHTDLDPAVKAEFAHAVYRFGHSMLTETISRTNANKSDNSLSLLEGFLNPPSYTDGGPAGALTSEEAAGSIVMGMSDQTGNELDEFMTETLRSNLVGLPLDLAATNIARARETGIPSLNNLRRQIHNATGDAQLTPYTSWADFGQNVKHPESVINFVAAYGTHPKITSQTTAAGKRTAAKALVDPDIAAPEPDSDAVDFMNSTGAWASAETGLNKVDLWVGGLAEKTNLFGGLLGSTFNYVFERQMTELQNGDRFYYLARLPGLNLRAQVEGNSFSEMIIRNTDGTNTLKADVFATADCKFQLANLAGTAAGYGLYGATVNDDPSTECNEQQLLLRKPDGTLQYREANTVDPSGINGQGVYNGTSGVDRVTGGNDNDTVWLGPGNDILEGQGGDDVALGGEGDDRITDSAGADVPKGGPGDDYLHGGIGIDIIMGGDGQDVTNGGANDNETFGGEGSDFMQSGDGSDVTFGDGGDDWIQGGSGQDLLLGDHGAPFFDDPAQTQPGNDVFVGQVGENDYDAEGGDDIMSANAAVDRYAGSAGYDWATHQYDTVGADDDMNVNRLAIGTALPLIVNRDRWQEVEASSGSAFNDILRGDDAVPSSVGGGGFTGCNVLDQAGISRIAGLGDIVPTPSAPLGPVEVASAPGQCPLEGNVWGEGNILLGGLGSDTIEGRGANDILDGDRYLKVRISVRNDEGNEIGTTDLLEKPYQAGSTRTLAADVASGVIDPGNLVVVREIVTPTVAATDGNRDSAVFSDIAAAYTVTTTGGDGTLGSPGSVTTVKHNATSGGGAGTSDGTDTLRNIERLVFSDTAPPATPVLEFVIAGDGEAAVHFTPPGGVITGYTVKVVDAAGAQVGELRDAPADANSLVVTGLTNGTAYRFQISATNAEGTSPYSALSEPVTPEAPVVAGLPGAPTIDTPIPWDGAVTVRWTAPTSTGGSRIEGYLIRVYSGDVEVRSESLFGSSGTIDVMDLTNGTPYTFDVRAFNEAGIGESSERSVAVTPTGPTATAPDAPTIGAPTAGDASATVRWTAPESDGGSEITGYSVRVYAGTTLAKTQAVTGNVASVVVTGLTNGTAYTFDVSAVNAVDTGAASARSTSVTPVAPATAPGAPTVGAPTAGNASATVRWTAPASIGGSAITGYSVRAYAGTTLAKTQAVTGDVASVLVTGLTNGTAYTFDVSAVNAVGTGAASARSASVTPTGSTSRQVLVTAEADTIVKQASPTTSFGSTTALAADLQDTTSTSSAVHSYLRFNVAGLASGETVTAASLRLRSLPTSGGTPNGPIVRRAVNAASVSAAEALTWNGSNPTANTSNVGNFGSIGHDVVVSTAVSGVTGNGVVTLQLAPESTDGLFFRDRTFTTTGDRPQLVLTVSTSGATTPPPASSVSPASGTYTSAQTVTATNTQAGVTHRYTVGAGTTVPANPTTSSPTLPAGGLLVSSSSVVKVAAFDAAGNSSVVTRNYTISASASTRTVTVTAEADAMVKQASAGTTFGTPTTLISDLQELSTTGSAVHTYLRFNVTGLAAGETVTAASLRLRTTPTSGGSNNGPIIRRASNAASATAAEALTWNGSNPTANTSNVGNFGALTTSHDVAVSTAVSGVTGNGVVTLQLAPESTDGLLFRDRTSATAGDRPSLVLTVRRP